MKKLSNETQSTVRLVARREFGDGTTTAQATCSGFLCRHNGQAFVVTCWHCLSGLSAATEQPLGTFTPNKITVLGRFAKKLEDQDPWVSMPFQNDLGTEDNDGNYLWFEHPSGNKVDVCAIGLPISEDANHKLKCLNEIDFTEKFKAEPATDAFIIGYPEGFSGQSNTPIFKRATVASEPDLDFLGQPIVLVDCMGNRGLSGAPVIIRGSGILVDEEISDNTLLGSWQNFLGVYSGRVSENGIGAQLGRVWKSDCVHELFEQLAPGPRGV